MNIITFSITGPNVGSPDITMRPEEIPSDVPCTGQFDTITRTSDGGTYAFKGNMVFKLDNNAIGLESGFPTEISSVFADLPNDLDASVFYEDVGKTYFFKVSEARPNPLQTPSDQTPSYLNFAKETHREEERRCNDPAWSC